MTKSSDLLMEKCALLISLIRNFLLQNCIISSNLSNSISGMNKLQSLHACVKYLIGRRNVDKNWRTFLPMTSFFAIYFFTDNYFYRQIFLPIYFYKKEHLVFSNLKIPLVYLFDFKFDLTHKT